MECFGDAPNSSDIWGNLSGRSNYWTGMWFLEQKTHLRCCVHPEKHPSDHHSQKARKELPQKSHLTARPPPGCSISEEWVLPSPTSGSSLTHKCLSVMMPWSCHLCPRPFTSLAPTLASRPPNVSLGSSAVSAHSNYSVSTWCMIDGLKQQRMVDSNFWRLEV